MARPVRVRFAPSPTGYLHIGGARTAIYDWLLARATGGQFILRIEDTDRSRFVPDALDDILESLRWLGLDWDEGPDVGGPHGPYLQSERLAIYQEHARRLVEEGQAYYCFCSEARLAALRAAQQAAKAEVVGYDRRCRELPPAEVEAALRRGEKAVIRFKMPLEGETTFRDAIRGEITVANRLLDDMVLLKSDGFPTYHLASVVDDHLMGITHVLRGDEWLPSTPRHIRLYAAFGWDAPVFAHLPVFLNPEGGGKLSKRHGATSVREYREKGYLPEALFNFLLLLGWHPSEDRELFTREEAVAAFSLERVSKTPVAFSLDKLDWYNGVYIRNLSPEELVRRCLPFLQRAGLLPDPCPPEKFAAAVKVAPLLRERIHFLTDAPEQFGIFLRDEIPPPPREMLLGKKLAPETARNVLARAAAVFAELPSFDEASLEPALRNIAREMGLKDGEVFMLLRVAVTGRTASPGIFETLAAIGRERCLERVEKAGKVLAEEKER